MYEENQEKQVVTFKLVFDDDISEETIKKFLEELRKQIEEKGGTLELKRQS